MYNFIIEFILPLLSVLTAIFILAFIKTIYSKKANQNENTVSIKDKLDKSNWVQKASKKLKKEYYLEHTSWLNDERKIEITKELISSLYELRQHRLTHLKTLNKLHHKNSLLTDKTLPAWVRVNTIDSKKGYRLIIGFRNTTCEYRKNDILEIGCFNCGFYAGTAYSEPADISDLLQQIYKAFQYGYNYGHNFDVIEFLNDGSFINNKEINSTARDRIFEILNKMSYINRILIESSPEYIISAKQEIINILKKLREGQSLEIGIGLETSDDFIRKACINKNFNLKQFERAIETISALKIDNQLNQCDVVAYLLVKPAFLSTQETITDIMTSLRYIEDISDKYNINVIPKLEPAAISNGTILSLLNSKTNSSSYYKPLNYWTILEILTKLFLDNRYKKTISKIRIGAREDMDDIIKVPAIYNEDGRYDQFDFILYDSIQQFNHHHDIFKLYAMIENTYKGGLYELINQDNAFNNWIRADYKDNTVSIVDFIKENMKSIKQATCVRITTLESKFLRIIYQALDLIEGYSPDTRYIKRLTKLLSTNIYPYKKEISIKVKDLLYDAFRLDDNFLYDITVEDIKRETHGFRIFFEIRDYITGRRYSLWTLVPKKLNI